MNKLETLFLIGLILVALFLKGHNLEKRLSFGWDQERDAQMVWDILKEGKLTLIGPRVISDDAFFLGPVWYYLLVPFYFLFGMNPLASGVFIIFFGVATTIGAYFVTKYFFGVKQAIIVSLIWASITDLVSWNPALIPLVTILLLLFLAKIVEGKDKFIPYALLLIGISLQLHFQAVFFFIPFFLAIFFCVKVSNRFPLNKLLLGALLFLLTLTPLLVFDLRHNFLNLKGFIKLFFSTTNDKSQFLGLYKFSWTIEKYIENFSSIVPNKYPATIKLLLGSSIFCLSIIGIFTSSISSRKKSLLLLLILLPPLMYSLYKGNISEYYFALTFIPILIGFSNFFIKIKLFNIGNLAIGIILIWLFVNRIILVTSNEDKQGLFYKKEAVKYIVDQKIDKIFNVSYSVPVNGDPGFRFLFKYFGKEPQNIPEGHLWTIVIPANGENIPPVAVFGDIGIIRR